MGKANPDSFCIVLYSEHVTQLTQDNPAIPAVGSQ